jgi:hypothetical protein
MQRWQNVMQASLRRRIGVLFCEACRLMEFWAEDGDNTPIATWNIFEREPAGDAGIR